MGSQVKSEFPMIRLMGLHNTRTRRLRLKGFSGGILSSTRLSSKTYVKNIFNLFVSKVNKLHK